MTQPPYAPILELTRGPVVESIHFGSIAVCDAAGRLAAWYGDPNAVAYLRSSAKPFQALPFLEHGGQAAYQLTLQEVALICASHSGADAHLAVALSLQAKTGVQESELLCGVHPLAHQETVQAMRQRGEANRPNRHNCSGKHSGMLAYLRLKQQRGEALPPDLPYIHPDHPLQQEILRAFAEMCALPPEQVAVGVDGCSAPNFAAPLRNAALGYARLCDPAALPPARAAACRLIVSAMTAHADMVGGPDSFDTLLMKTTQGRILSKGGAEGYQALGVLPGALGPGSPALGIALKISDGDLGGHNPPGGRSRGYARPAAALEALRQLGALSPQELETLSAYGPSFKLFNWREIEVGEGRPCFRLQRADGRPDA